MGTGYVTTTVWLTESTTTPEGKKVWGAHQTQVRYGQKLPCMFRWVHEDTDHKLPRVMVGLTDWVPCDQC